jgi:hypothetical protein
METAYHEAGHVVLAIVLGARVSHATIEPDRDDGPERYGDIRVLWPTGKWTAQVFQKKLVLTALAGPVAEMIYTGEPLHPGFVAEWADDWQQAFESAALLVPNERQRLAWLEAQIRQLHSDLNARYWPAIAALADELSAHETLEEEQIITALEPWLS